MMEENKIQMYTLLWEKAKEFQMKVAFRVPVYSTYGLAHTGVLNV